MNTENVKNKRGRPANPNKTKVITLLNGQPRGKGRPSKLAFDVKVTKVTIPFNEDWNLEKHGIGNPV